MRYKFLTWLRLKVFKTPEATVPCLMLRIIYNILFPLNWFYQRQSFMRYDVVHNIFYIRDEAFTSEDLFTLLAHKKYLETKKKLYEKVQQ